MISIKALKVCLCIFLTFAIFITRNVILDSGNIRAFNVSLPFDVKNPNNIAVLFTMTDEGGRIENLNMMKSIFEDGSLGFHCEKYHNVSSKTIYEKIKQVSSELDEEGTLLLYFNSHGGGSGKNFAMQANGASLKFSKVIRSILEGKKVKRLIILVDTCHAEGAINEGFQGGGKLIRNIKTDSIELPKHYSGNKLPRFLQFFTDEDNLLYYGENSGAYEELLVISSSSSEDLSMRGAFAERFKRSFNEIKNDENPTVASFLKKFAAMHNNTKQQPYYKAIPEEILSEPLFKNLPSRDIAIKSNDGKTYKKSYILMPLKTK